MGDFVSVLFSSIIDTETGEDLQPATEITTNTKIKYTIWLKYLGIANLIFGWDIV